MKSRVAVKSMLAGLAAAVMVTSIQLPAGAEASGSAPESGTLTVIDAALEEAGAQPAARDLAMSAPTAADDEVTVAAATAEGNVVEIGMSVPTVGKGQVQSDGMTRVYNGEAEATQVAVQPVDNGARALVVLESDAAPTSHDFSFTTGVASLQSDADGSVTAFDAAGAPVAVVEAPWAVDAGGKALPTHYEVDGLQITQVVDTSGDVQYPVVADPVWAVVAAAAAACAKGALVGVATTYLVDFILGQHTSKESVIVNAVVGCILPGLGWAATVAWKVLPAAAKRAVVREVLIIVLKLRKK